MNDGSANSTQATLGTVAELWRYPVKSLGGERLSRVACDARGLAGDRWWAVRGADTKLGSGKTTRRFRRMPGLLSISARLDETGVTWVEDAEGRRAPAGDPGAAEIVSAVVGEPVSLTEEAATPHFDASALHLLTASSLAWMDSIRPDDRVEARRFRPNVVVEVADVAAHDVRPEERWLGRTLRIGEVTVRVERTTQRCVMVTMAQPALAFSPGILRELARRTGCMFGVYCDVLEVGTIKAGDEVRVIG